MYNRNCFKNLIEEDSDRGKWGKMYYCFTDLDRYDSAYILNYLIDSEPVPEAYCLDVGYEDYLRYSNSFISQRLGCGMTQFILSKCLNDLEKHNYIFIHHKDGKNNTFRYIKLNYKKIAQAIGAQLAPN